MASTSEATQNQLKTVGPADEYISGNPTSSLFQYEYQRAPNHATHTANLHSIDTFDFGKTVTIDIPPEHGHLLHKMSVYVKLPPLPIAPGSTYTGWTNAVGYALIEQADFVIGSLSVARLTGLWMEVTDYLTQSLDKRVGLDKATGRYDTHRVLPIDAKGVKDLHIPLGFWFTKTVAQAYPLFLAYEHGVSVKLKLRRFQDLVTYDGPTPPIEMSIMDSGLIVDYIMLADDDVNNLTAMPKVEYLFEQWYTDTFKEITANTTITQLDLDYRNCLKEVLWVLVETESESNNDYFNYGRRDPLFEGGELFTRAGLMLNNKERFAKLPESYYRMIVPWKYHTASSDRNIYVMSFSQSPEINQPTGIFNLSNYSESDVKLVLDMVPNSPTCKLYTLGITYNVLTIESGKVSIAFV